MGRRAAWWQSSRLPFFVAFRYLFSRKRVGAINVISAISVIGVAFGTAALVCTLSVFNGFHDLIGGLYTAFDPQLEITPAKGKYLQETDTDLERMRRHPDVEASSAYLEENALILFKGRPVVVQIKGVDDNFDKVTSIRSILYGEGAYKLHAADIDYGIPGVGLAASMGGVDYGTLQICAPLKGEQVNMANLLESFNVADITSPNVCFETNQRKFDENGLVTSLAFAQKLFDRSGHATSIGLKLRPGADESSVKARLRQDAGGRFLVKDRLEQQEDMYRMMNIEKMLAYVFLTFILFVACFNIIGSVSMLIIDKREDMRTLRCLGADCKLVFRVFLYESRLIVLLGAAIGVTLGLLLCWLQQSYGLLRLGGSEGGFIVDAYPVSIHAADVMLVLATVVVVGFASVWWPVRYLTRRLL